MIMKLRSEVVIEDGDEDTGVEPQGSRQAIGGGGVLRWAAELRLSAAAEGVVRCRLFEAPEGVEGDDSDAGAATDVKCEAARGDVAEVLTILCPWGEKVVRLGREARGSCDDADAQMRK